MSEHRLSDIGGDGGQRGVAPMPGAWLVVLRRYLLAVAVGNLVWEFAQLPLYTIWYEGRPGSIAFAALHCTGGDVLIASSALLAPLLVLGNRHWPYQGYHTVALAAILGGLAYTVLSEWLNVEVRRSWTYTDLMPRLPLIGTGLSPLGQWLVVPSLAFWWARRPALTPTPSTRSSP